MTHGQENLGQGRAGSILKHREPNSTFEKASSVVFTRVERFITGGVRFDSFVE